MIPLGMLGAATPRDGGGGGGGDPYWANVVSLLHFDGTDGSTTFADQKGKVWTANGNAQIDTAQKKFGSGALLLDGSGDYINADGSADFAFGIGDFTIEGWLRFAAIAGPSVFFDFRASGVNAAPCPYCYLDTTNIVYNVSAGDRIVGAHGVTAGTFVHVAVCRASGVTRAFINGAQKGGDWVDARSLVVGASRPTIGAQGGNTPGQFPMNGHADDLRITKGVARYSANFTPPAAPFPDS